jgi:hypothetical protein
MNDSQAFRKSVLASVGAGPAEIEELLLYNELLFNPVASEDFSFPLPDEPFVEIWEGYTREVQQTGSIGVLSKYLVQLRFPVLSGMSQNVEYADATRRGTNPENMESASGIQLRYPEQCQLVMHQTPGGRIPLVIAGAREDFVFLIQALTKRNEPVTIPDSMGACIISGYNNWHRIQILRAAFEAAGSPQGPWPEEFHRISLQKDLYQDRFVVLSRGPYSGVAAADLALEEESWMAISLSLRREHECAHYLTRRVFASMRNNLIDELIADYWAISTTLGGFRADWLLRFFGVEAFPKYREGARLQNYRGTPALTDGSFRILQRLVINAAENLERFDRICARELRQADIQPVLFMALTRLTVEEIASEDGGALLPKFFLKAMQEHFNTNHLTSPPRRVLA